MRYRLTEINLGLDYIAAELRAAICAKAAISDAELIEFSIVRRSLDARKQPVFNFVVDFDCDRELSETAHLKLAEVKTTPGVIDRCIAPAGLQRPVVVGAGPAGLMAALVLARAGLKPLLIERGRSAAERAVQVESFWRGGQFDRESNVLYGEGGAGLFSDGKLTARSKDREALRYFLAALVDCGAEPEIMIEAEPHVGTDKLHEIVPRLRAMIIAAGGEVCFGSRLEALSIENGRLSGLVVGGRPVNADSLILATGHSARDVYAMLAECGALLEPKAFAVGLRVELPQKLVDRQQFGRYAGHPRLGAASFRLTRRPEGAARACYSFCMCPGGHVIACASEPQAFTVNGMSYAARAGRLANAAFLVPVEPQDYQGLSPQNALSGLVFQEAIERRAFVAGGGDYGVPAANLKRFLYGADLPIKAERSLERAVEAELDQVLPDFVSRTLKLALPRMLTVFGGLRPEDVTLYAAETRSSSPVRVVRGADGQASGLAGLYPCGEGAGYAGGIVSSAIDGIRQAESLLRNIQSS